MDELKRKEVIKEIDSIGDRIVEIQTVLEMLLKRLQELEEFIGGDRK